MSIVMLENFSGSAPGVDYRASGFFGAYPGAWRLASNGATMGGKTDILTVEESNGKFWLAAFNSGARYAGPAMAGVIPTGAGRFILGARFRMRNLIGGTLSLLFSHVVNISLANYVVAAGVEEFYAEFVIDRSDWSLELWVDGRMISRGTIANTTARTALTNSSETLLFPMGTTLYPMVTDVYLIVDTGDDTPNSRIGPQDITRVPLEPVPEAPTGEWDTIALNDVLARKDYSTDSGTRVSGLGIDAEVKLQVAAGYTLPNDTRVNATALVVKSNYKPGAPSDLEATIVRGSSQDTATPDQPYSAVLPQIKLVNSSRTAEQRAASTALDGLEVSLKVKSR